MRKYIIPFGFFIKIIISILFLVIAILDIVLWKKTLLAIISLLIFIFFILFGVKIIVLRDDCIYVSPDLLFGWYKVQYKEKIQIKYVEVKTRDHTYSSRGKEKTGKGIETIRTGNKFIEFIYQDESIKRIYCLDLSNKQINKILEFCIKKNIEIK